MLTQTAQVGLIERTPLLKRMAEQGWVRRERAQDDERVVHIHLTESGLALKAQCACIPQQLLTKIGYPMDEGRALKGSLDRLVQHLLALDAAG